MSVLAMPGARWSSGSSSTAPEEPRRLGDCSTQRKRRLAYTLISTDDIETAMAFAQVWPLLARGGGIEVQETFLRAWRYFSAHRGDASFRAWLYRIATNVCLRKRARLANDRLNVSTAFAGIVPTMRPPYKLSPYPDALLDQLESPSGNPGAEYDRYESVQLAFLGAVQLLPPRQRAVLILHDVVGFTATEVANMLDSTAASVNSALNRARATLQ